MKNILLFCFLSFSVVAENVDNKQENLTSTEVVKLQVDLKELDSRVSKALEANQSLVSQGNELINKATELVTNQTKKQDEFALLLNEVKQFKESKTDLEFSIATDKPYVISVVLSILLSALVTWMLLRKDATAGHKRLIKEFRQSWVNDFRDTVSNYLDKIVQVQAFQQNNINFKITRNALISIRNEFDEKKKEIDAKDIALIDKVKEKLAVTRMYERELKKEFDKNYQSKNNEYLALLSSTKVLSSKLHLLLKPTFEEKDVRDKRVYDALTQIEDYLNNPYTRHSVMNHDVLVHYNQELLMSTQELLKSEWDKIKDSSKV